MKYVGYEHRVLVKKNQSLKFYLKKINRSRGGQIWGVARRPGIKDLKPKSLKNWYKVDTCQHVVDK